MKPLIFRAYVIAMVWMAIAAWTATPANAQQNAQQNADQASVKTAISPDGSGSIVIEAHGKIPEPPVFYTASATANVNVTADFVEHSIRLAVKVIQGKAETLSFGLNGQGRVVSVAGDKVRSWSVRKMGEQRFLDLQLNTGVTEIKPLITIRSPDPAIPGSMELTHITPGDSVGFDSTVTIQSAPEIQLRIEQVQGFTPLQSPESSNDHAAIIRLQSSTGGLIKLGLVPSGASPAPVELTDTRLTGKLSPDGKSIAFQLQATAHVSEDQAELTVLSGNAAVSKMPTGQKFQLQLKRQKERHVYQLMFPEAGTHAVTLEFVAALQTAESGQRTMDFSVATGAVVPMAITGLDPNLEFHRDQESVVPQREQDSWVGFLPATGRAKLQWKASRETSDGKLFFTSTGKVEAKLGAGLLRQDHQIDYRVLQGQLKSLSLALQGPGEILDVQGQHIVAWKVIGEGNDRRLDITLGQPLTGENQIKVRSQTPLGAFPVRVEGTATESRSARFGTPVTCD